MRIINAPKPLSDYIIIEIINETNWSQSTLIVSNNVRTIHRLPPMDTTQYDRSAQRIVQNTPIKFTLIDSLLGAAASQQERCKPCNSRYPPT